MVKTIKTGNFCMYISEKLIVITTQLALVMFGCQPLLEKPKFRFSNKVNPTILC